MQGKEKEREKTRRKRVDEDGKERRGAKRGWREKSPRGWRKKSRSSSGNEGWRYSADAPEVDGHDQSAWRG